MFIKELILIAYMLCIILGASALTISLLGRNRGKADFNRTMAFFAVGMLIICFYDMAIYYLDYVIGGLNSLKIMRIGNCIIAGNMFLWLSVQEKIIKREALQLINEAVKRYLAFYAAMLIWNYVSYFWGETSVYWGNSEFIRAPLDLTIIFWLVISIVTLVFVYQRVFLETFSESTVKTHIYNIFRKMDVKNRVGVICIINGDIEDGQAEE